MEPRRSRSRGEFVAAATALVETRGWGVLTMRALGEAMGIEHSIIYRHFANKKDLIDAVLDHALTSLHDDLLGDSPRDRVVAKLIAFRQLIRKNPYLGPAMMGRRSSSDAGLRFIRAQVDLLKAMGLEGERLVSCYHALDTITIGAAVYDYGAGSSPLGVCQTQYLALGLETFDAAASDLDTLANLADEAFRISAYAVLDTFTAPAH
ncbi:MAG: TetR/AcrR family transcriptional regulator [Ilumatobacteraceae bacterium]